MILHAEVKWEPLPLSNEAKRKIQDCYWTCLQQQFLTHHQVPRCLTCQLARLRCLWSFRHVISFSILDDIVSSKMMLHWLAHHASLCPEDFAVGLVVFHCPKRRVSDTWGWFWWLMARAESALSIKLKGDQNLILTFHPAVGRANSGKSPSPSLHCCNPCAFRESCTSELSSPWPAGPFCEAG